MTTNQKETITYCIWAAALAAEMAVVSMFAIGIPGLVIVLAIISLIAGRVGLSLRSSSKFTPKALGDPTSSLDSNIYRLLRAMGFGDQDATSRLLAVTIVVLRLVYRLDRPPTSPTELLERLDFVTLSERYKDIKALDITPGDIQEVRLRCVAVPDLQQVLPELTDEDTPSLEENGSK